MNISFVKFVEAVKTGRSENEILFAMDEQYQIHFDKNTNLLHVMCRKTNKKCLVPLYNILYMNELIVVKSLSPNGKDK